MPRGFLPKPLLRADKMQKMNWSRFCENPYPQKIVSQNRVRIEAPPHYLNTWKAEPQKEKCPFHFRKNPPPRKSKEQATFFFLWCRVKRGGGGAFVERTIQFRTTTRFARAISRDCFQNKFEFCTIDTAIYFQSLSNSFLYSPIFPFCHIYCKYPDAKLIKSPEPPNPTLYIIPVFLS